MQYGINHVICCSVHCLPLQLHTSEVGDGYDWNRVDLRSVTEESRLDEFLHTAQLAGTEFTAGGLAPLAGGLWVGELLSCFIQTSVLFIQGV